MSDMPHLYLVKPPTAEIPVQAQPEPTAQEVAVRLIAVATESAPSHDLQDIRLPETLNKYDIRYIGNVALSAVDKRPEAKFVQRKTLGLLGSCALMKGDLEVTRASADYLKQLGGFWGRHEARKLNRAIRKRIRQNPLQTS